MDPFTLNVTSAEQDFYGDALILLEGAISEFLSCLQMIRRYQAHLGQRDPVASFQARIKRAESMQRKLAQRGLPLTAASALRDVQDAAGVRLICPFQQDIYRTAALLREIPGARVLREKDYIQSPKPNGYRSSHMILSLPLRFLPVQPEFPVFFRGAAAHPCHGLLGQHRAPAQVQAGGARPAADRAGAQEVRGRDHLHGPEPGDDSEPDRGPALTNCRKEEARMRILVADDEPEMTRVLEALLTREHFSVDVVHDGQDALHYGLAQNYDCLVLDIMMPKMDGIEVLRALRAENVSTPVLLLTAKSQVEDRIAGLDSGADDYLPKPFHNGEFLARVRALTRRGQAYTPSVLTCGNIALDCSTFELRCGASFLRLGSKEFQMLELLLRRKGRCISTEEFMERIWGYDSEAEINVVWAYVSYLRRKLEAVGANVRILARRGQGYFLEEGA